MLASAAENLSFYSSAVHVAGTSSRRGRPRSARSGLRGSQRSVAKPCRWPDSDWCRATGSSTPQQEPYGRSCDESHPMGKRCHLPRRSGRVLQRTRQCSTSTVWSGAHLTRNYSAYSSASKLRIITSSRVFQPIGMLRIPGTMNCQKPRLPLVAMKFFQDRDSPRRICLLDIKDAAFSFSCRVIRNMMLRAYSGESVGTSKDFSLEREIAIQSCHAAVSKNRPRAAPSALRRRARQQHLRRRSFCCRASRPCRRRTRSQLAATRNQYLRELALLFGWSRSPENAPAGLPRLRLTVECVYHEKSGESALYLPALSRSCYR